MKLLLSDMILKEDNARTIATKTGSNLLNGCRADAFQIIFCQHLLNLHTFKDQQKPLCFSTTRIVCHNFHKYRATIQISAHLVGNVALLHVCFPPIVY